MNPIYPVSYLTINASFKKYTDFLNIKKVYILR